MIDKLIYVSCAMDEESFLDLFKDTKKVPGQQAQKFNRLMQEGLAQNSMKVYATTGRPITAENSTKKFYRAVNIKRKDNLTYHYCSTLNCPGLKSLWQFITVLFNVVIGLREGTSVVVIDVLNASIAYAAALAAQIRQCPCVAIVTDLPELMSTKVNPRYVNLVKKTLEKCTDYVLLTEQMNERVNPIGKPFVVIEGLCDSQIGPPQIQYESQAMKNRKCIYAGFLDERYGVKTMVDGFVMANIPNAELHIYGNGPYADELQKMTQKYSNVIYHGVVMNEEVVRAEIEADLLINPRPTHEEFTKYSFPSKNMEYMASGTPVLTTKLPGMPSEYYPYVYLFDDESVEGIAKTLKKVLSTTPAELHRKSKEAQRFVLKNKNNIVQTAKLIDMIERGV